MDQLKSEKQQLIDENDRLLNELKNERTNVEQLRREHAKALTRLKVQYDEDLQHLVTSYNENRYVRTFLNTIALVSFYIAIIVSRN